MNKDLTAEPIAAATQRRQRRAILSANFPIGMGVLGTVASVADGFARAHPILSALQFILLSIAIGLRLFVGRTVGGFR